MLQELIKKYGDDFNWWIPKDMDFLNEEIKEELVKEHKLYGKNLKAIAKCESNDDVLFRDENKIYIVHLLWNKGSKELPLYIEFLYSEEAINYIEKEYINKYKG